jgi:hypothetical protein
LLGQVFVLSRLSLIPDAKKPTFSAHPTLILLPPGLRSGRELYCPPPCRFHNRPPYPCAAHPPVLRQVTAVLQPVRRRAGWESAPLAATFWLPVGPRVLLDGMLLSLFSFVAK